MLPYFLFFLFLICPVFAQAEPLPVVASFSVLGDMVEQIGGDDVAVETLVGRNADAHVYEPTPADVRKLNAAKILFVNGLGLEGWMDRLVLSSQFKGVVVTVSTGIHSRRINVEEGRAELVDPHAWQDLSNGLIYVQNIAGVLEKAWPEKKSEFQKRAEIYEEKIRREDETWRAAVNAVPIEKRQVITSHDAFGYLGDAYGIRFYAPVGISTEAEPRPADIARLIEQMKGQKIKTVFLENKTSPRLAEQLAKEGGAKLGDNLYADTLSERTGPASTYLDMFRHNFPLLIKAMVENGGR